MKSALSPLALLFLFAATTLGADWAVPAGPLVQGKEPPADWIDPATGHRIIRLSGDGGAQSLYFHQQSYTDKGDKIVVNRKGGLAAIDISNLGTKPPTIEQIGKGGGNVIVGKKTRQVYFITGGTLWATHIDTKVTREIAKLPKGFNQASGLAINADETLVASTGNDPEAKEKAGLPDSADKDNFFPKNPAPEGKMKPGGKSLCLFTVNTKTGEIKKVHYSTDWLNHTQFSPTDPQQLLFCHEGTWDYTNRIWSIRADGTGLKKTHTRTMVNEIFGHEFFSYDGAMVWYDLQTPRSTQFWLAGVNLQTGERLRYPLERQQWSVHYNQSHDGKLFSGDGGGPNSVANRALKGTKLDGPGNAQWIYLFTPKSDKLETLKVGGEDVKVGKFEVEKLVDLSKHNYTLEPNATFTPDNKWIIFRSNMHPPTTHVYAVEIKKTGQK